jgi:serine/threonine protein phosphatase 1
MTFFVVSDIHGFFTPFKEALDRADFDANNENHYLISCGDMFDRGPDSEELLKYVMSLERKILIRGNHDLLFDDLCYRGFPYSHDKHNGTVRTVQDLGGSIISRNFENCCEIALNKTKNYRDQLVNYFETENYIFVHSWIPTSIHFKGDSKPWYQRGKVCSWLEDWRNASDAEWESAMWGNPFLMAQAGLNKTGKTIVFGHWHCSAGHVLNNIEGIFSEFDENACWEPYENKEQGIIGIDRCTVHTGEVNVLVLEDDFLEKP